MSGDRIWIWFADNGNIRKWSREPFEEGSEFVSTGNDQPVAQTKSWASPKWSDEPKQTITGEAPARLANALSDVINTTLRRGMETDEIVSVAAAVIADYARIEYGDAYLKSLTEVIMSRCGQPSPIVIGPITS